MSLDDLVRRVRACRICLGAHAMRWHMGAAFGGSVDAAVRNWRRGLDLRPAIIALPQPLEAPGAAF